jgi:hypothetical protein
MLLLMPLNICIRRERDGFQAIDRVLVVHHHKAFDVVEGVKLILHLGDQHLLVSSENLEVRVHSSNPSHLQ